MSIFRSTWRYRATAALACALSLPAAEAADFSVSPIRAELKGGSLSETITVTNDSANRLRVTAKLMLWTQDEQGKDVYTDSSDLVYFPRQLEIEPGGKRLVRVGAKSSADGTERAYRLFIEEVPEPAAGGAATVSFYFRFGVPLFVVPATSQPAPDIEEPTLSNGKLKMVVRNKGTRHFRATRFVVSDGAAFTKEAAGWYSLPGTSRTYEVEVPADVCRRSPSLSVRLEGEGLGIERKLNVNTASCS